jgi:hypothetical protein
MGDEHNVHVAAVTDMVESIEQLSHLLPCHDRTLVVRHVLLLVSLEYVLKNILLRETLGPINRI